MLCYLDGMIELIHVKFHACVYDMIHDVPAKLIPHENYRTLQNFNRRKS